MKKLAFALVLGLTSQFAHPINYVVNGGFESPLAPGGIEFNGVPDGWSSGNGGFIRQGESGSLSSGAGRQWFLLFQGESAPPLAQHVALDPGMHVLTFRYSGSGTSIADRLHFSFGSFQSHVDLSPDAVFAGAPWHTHTQRFHADGPGELRFWLDDPQGHPEASGAPLDAVGICRVPLLSRLFR